MATIESDGMLEELAYDIDKALFKWLSAYEMPPLNLTAVILSRLTWLSKQGEYEQDFLKLLEAPQKILNEQEHKGVLH